MSQVLHTGQTDAKIKLRVDYEDQTQVNENFLANATKLEILYHWDKEDTTTTAATSGTWTASGYEFIASVPHLYYEFHGTDAVPVDGTGYLLLRAKITDSASRISIGTMGSIRVLDSAL